MIDVFRDWINSILGVGIIFTIVRMILPDTNLKKYICSLIGIVTIITIITPVINILENVDILDIKEVLLESTNALDKENELYTDTSDYEEIGKDNVKEELENNVAEKIKQSIKENVENDIDVEVTITDEYDINGVDITIYGDYSFDIASFVESEYQILQDKVHIINGG